MRHNILQLILPAVAAACIMNQMPLSEVLNLNIFQLGSSSLIPWLKGEVEGWLR